MSDPTTTIGQRRVAAVTSSGVERLEREERRRRVAFPQKGGSYNGVPPAAWRTEGPFDETGELPEDCPVKPLGYEGENFYFVDTMGQVFSTGGKACGVERMQILFAGMEDFLCWAWPAFSGRGANQFVSGFKAEEARRDLYAACRNRGPWSPTDFIRGRGAWRDEEGRLILHCGEELYIDGRPEDTGEHGDYFYVRRPRANLPWAKPVDLDADNPAIELVEHLRSWNFVRGDVDVMLMLGWIGVALMGAALDWRPSVFLVGDAGTGKSTLHGVIKAIMGRGMISTTNATSAGLYQIVGHDALPICIDELEGDDAGDQAQQVIKMARDAASGSVRIRGGADHKGVEFAARSAFLFSAINPPPINKASLSRLAVLQLRELEKGAKQQVLKSTDTIGPKLLRRVADHFYDFIGEGGLLEQYKAELYETGHSSRGQMTFGTFLAAAELLLGNSGMEAAGLVRSRQHWAIALAAATTAEVSGGQPNWAQCIEEFLTAPVDAWNKGDRKTVGQVLDDLVRDRNNSELNSARKDLAAAGLGVLEFGRGFEGYALAIPHEGKDVNKLMADTKWGGRGSTGGWSWALRLAPYDIVRQKVPQLGAGPEGKLDNRLSIGGVQRRCTFIGLNELRKWQEEQG